MKSIRPVQISGIGCYVPERVLTNHDLSKIVEHLGRMDPPENQPESQNAASSTKARQPPTWPSRLYAGYAASLRIKIRTRLNC